MVDPDGGFWLAAFIDRKRHYWEEENQMEGYDPDIIGKVNGKEVWREKTNDPYNEVYEYSEADKMRFLTAHYLTDKEGNKLGDLGTTLPGAEIEARRPDRTVVYRDPGDGGNLQTIPHDPALKMIETSGGNNGLTFEMMRHFQHGGGADYNLSKPQFNSLMENGKYNPQIFNWNKAKIKYSPEGQFLWAVPTNFYAGNKYGLACPSPQKCYSLKVEKRF